MSNDPRRPPPLWSSFATSLQFDLMRWMQPLAGTAVVLISLASPALAIEKKTYEYQSGKWPQVSNDIQTPLPEPTLDRAEMLIARGDPKPARTILVDWEATHKDSPVRDRCVFLLGEAYFGIDDR